MGSSRTVLILALIYIAITLLKIIFVLNIPSPFIFSDETFYSKTAKSFFESKTFSLWDKPATYPPPLYPAVLSIAYLFGDITAAYPVMKIINAFLSSLIMIPVFLIAREFLTERKSVYIAFLSSLLPASFSYTSTIMSENLFYPLFMFSLFFMMKSIAEQNKKWDMLCGVFIGLSILTKLHAFALLVSFLLALLLKWKAFSKTSVFSVLFFTALTALPWFLRNGYYSGFSLRGLLGVKVRALEGVPKHTTPTDIPVIDFIYWAMMHTGYFVFATGVILFALATLQSWKIMGKKINADCALAIISWASFLALVLFSTKQKFYGGPYLMGRYIDAVLPAFIVMGVTGLDFKNRDFKLFSFIIAFSSIALLFIPMNSLIRAFNTPDTYMLLIPRYMYEMGIISLEGVNLVRISLGLSPFIFLILAKKEKLKWRYIAPFLLLFFVAGSIIASGVMYKTSSDAQDEMMVGLWLHNHAQKNSTILFDERDVEKMRWALWGTMFWTDNRIKIGSVDSTDAEYIVSLHKLDLPLALTVRTETEVIQSHDNVYFVYLGR